MFKNLVLAGLASASLASAQKLLVASQSTNATLPGQILTLEAVENASSGPKTLSVVHTSTDCGILPTWLDVTLGSGTVLCLDESATPNLTALALQPDGSLKLVSKIATAGGAVGLRTYDNLSKVALAHYSPPQISLLDIDSQSKFESIQNFTFATSINATASPPKSKIHEAVLDPTGNFMLFLDLGADLVHVYRIDNCTGTMVEFGPLISKKDSGPRHATFFRPSNSSDTFLFVVHELSSGIVSYKVNYIPNGGLDFTIVQDVSTFGDRESPVDAKAAEIALSPDNRFLLASNRNFTSMFNVTNPDPKNSTQIASDSIVTYKLSQNGTLSFVQLAPSGGSFPRFFQMNKDGSQIAVANQVTMNVNIFSRNLETGLIGDLVAATTAPPGDGGLAYVQFIE